MLEIWIVITRAVIAFISLFIFTRIMGKREISQLTFFDYIVGITIGSIAATLTCDLNVRAFPQWAGLVTWVILALIFETIVLKNRWWAKVLDGEPTILIHNGKILEKNLAAIRFPITDLLEQLRQKDVFKMSDVEFAILETDGKISVQKKSQMQPVTPQDLKIPTGYAGISTELIQNGQVIFQNLQQLNLDEKWLAEKLKERGIEDLKQVVYASLDTSGILYIDQKQDHLGQVTNISDYPGPN